MVDVNLSVPSGVTPYLRSVTAEKSTVAVYSNAGLTVPVTLPYALSATAATTLYLGEVGQFRAVVTDATGAKVLGVGDGSANGATPLVFRPSTEGAPDLSGTYAPRWSRRDMPHPSLVDVVMGTPPTVGALATATAIASPVTWAATTYGGGASIPARSHFTYHGGNIQAMSQSVFPDRSYVVDNSLTDPVNSNRGPFGVSFYFDGTTLEVLAKGTGGNIRMYVDGLLVSATPSTFTLDGSQYFLPVTFATRAVRRITIYGSASFVFGGIVTGPNDSIWRTQQSGPRCIVLGDSFTDGTGATGGAATNWVRRFAATMGWTDTWSRGVGGTGYLNPGTGGRVKFRDRVAADVIAYSPDVVVVEGGINDAGTYTAAQIGAEALALFQQIRAGLPGALLIVLGPMWRNGVETFPSYLLPARDAIKAAAATMGTNTLFVDLLEMPIDTAYATTLAAGASAAATSISTVATPTQRTTLEIGTGTANVERRVAGSPTGGGPYSVPVAALTNTHSSGEAVNLVGPCLWTGTGRVGATTGSGNSDLLVSSDTTHPSQAGHDEIGAAVARLTAGLLAA